MSSPHADINKSLPIRVILAVGLLLLFTAFGVIGLTGNTSFLPWKSNAATSTPQTEQGAPENAEDAIRASHHAVSKEDLAPVQNKNHPEFSAKPKPPAGEETPFAEQPQPEQELLPTEETATAQLPSPAKAPADGSTHPENSAELGQEPTAASQPEHPATQQSTVAQSPSVDTRTLSWPPLIARLATEGFDATEMEKLFASLNSPPLPEFMAQKAIELYGRYGKASLNIDEENRANFAPPDYTRIAGGMTVAAGRRVMDTNRSFFEGLYKQYGVPAPFIVAIMMVETGLGSETGRQSALLALGSMAVADDLRTVLPVIKGLNSNMETMQKLIKARSDWAYTELKALIEYAKAVGKDASTIPGSVYGAIGICQFMPSNIPLYGVSTSKKRATPDLFILSDAAGSVARYLSAHGWRKTQTPTAQVQVLRSYNHSDVYASTVYGVAMALMSPTTHQGAAAARKGTNAVRAARESARAHIPSGKKNAAPIDALPNYSDLLK